jgi:hypothetical protein
MKKIALKSENGSVLLSVVIFMLIFTILGMSVLSVVNGEIAQARKDINRTKAFYLAEAGVERLASNLNSGNFTSIGTTTLGDGSYAVDFNVTPGEPCAVATGTAGGETRKIQMTMAFLLPPYENGIYAGGMDGNSWTFMLSGTGDPCIVIQGGKSVGDFNGKDIVNGNIFADGNVSLYGQSSVNQAPSPNTHNLNGDVNTTGTISTHDSASIHGNRIEHSTEMGPPDLIGMNYSVNNTHNVTKIFDNAGVTHGAPPAGNSLYDIFVINRSDSTACNNSTDGNDYYLDLHPGSSSYVGGAWDTAPTPINVGTDRVYYIDGNLWINSVNDTFGYNMSGKATIVVTGNIYICDNLKYANTSNDMLGLVALGKYNASGQRVSGGDIIFGDPTYGTMYTMSGMLFAAHDFLFNTRAIGAYDAEPESGFILNGSMAAMDKISLERDWYTISGNTRRPARYNPSTSQWYDYETGTVLTSAQVGTMKHYRMVLNYDDRVRSSSTQPKGLPRGAGMIYCGLTNWKELQ